MLISLPVLLALVWWSGTARTSAATADVTIDSTKVVEVRGLVVSRLATVGATKTAEDTAYTDGGRSDLTFRVPPGRLEEALVELNLVGGVVTRQQVSISDLNDGVDGISSGFDNLNSCLASLSDRIKTGAASAAAGDVDRCRQQLEATGKQLTASPQAARDAILNVHITKRSTTNPALVVAVVLLALALATMAYLTIRSGRTDRVFDVTDARAARPHEDLYHRRN